MGEAEQQVKAWLAEYGSEQACVAHLLCDRHPAHAPAVTEIGPDLTPTDTTFGELRESSQRLAAGLAGLGIGPGDRVATLMGRGTDLTTAALAIWRLGAVHVPLSPGFAPSAIALRLAASGAAAVIACPDQRPKLDPGPHTPVHVITAGPAPARPGEPTTRGLAENAGTAPARPVAVGGDAPFIRLYTSGAAGTPRGVDVPVRALAAIASYHHYGLEVADDDVYLNTADPGWSYGHFYGLVSPLLAGHRSLALNAPPDPELLLDVLATHGVTNFAATPTAYRALRATIKTVPPEIWVRRLSSAGEPLTAELLDWAYDTFGTHLGDHYGQTELGIVAADHNPRTRPGSIGAPLPGWDVLVLDALTDDPAPTGARGRIAVDLAASPAMWFTGYHGQPAHTPPRFTSSGRYYLTGDLGTREADATLRFAARTDDVIISAGQRIAPTDIETVLLEHPAVTETAVYGAPDDRYGQTVAAQVVAADPAPGLDAELHALLRDRFPAHTAPHRITFVAALPRTRAGKLQRARLRGPV
nr:AMP-binding protein [Murinocardiopsis flavida]